MGPTWDQHEPTWANFGPSWGHLGAILGPTWGQLGPTWATWANMGQLGANLGLTWGQLGANLAQHGASLGGSWALLALILPHFFAFVVRFDFSSSFFRFWKGLGRDLGGHDGRKIDSLDVLGDMLFETLFSVKLRVIFEKTNDEKQKEI